MPGGLLGRGGVGRRLGDGGSGGGVSARVDSSRRSLVAVELEFTAYLEEMFGHAE